MNLSEQDWQDMASVFRAGSVRAAGWEMNTAMQQHAEILEAQAVQCETIAWERALPRPGRQPLSHEHVHDHGLARHIHRHSHPFDSLDHGHDHEPGRGPVAMRGGEL